MLRSIKQRYRQLRHGLKVRLNYIANIRALRQLRRRLKRNLPERRLIAVTLLEHLGDIVACEPVVRHLKEKYPNSYFIWGVKQAYRELIDSHPLIDYTLIVHCLSERLMLKNAGVFDEVVDLHFSDRYCSLCRKPLKNNQSTSDINLTNYFNHGSLLSAMCVSAGLPPLDEAPKLTIPEEAIRKIDAIGLPANFIAVNCTSNAEEKNWPVEQWDELVDRIAENLDMQIVEIGLTPLISDKPYVLNLCSKLSILESAEVIKRANLFIGIDSGPAHIANAVMTPGVILIGSYLGFDKYNPLSGDYRNGSAATILHGKGSVKTITADHVFAEVKRHLDSL